MWDKSMHVRHLVNYIPLAEYQKQSWNFAVNGKPPPRSNFFPAQWCVMRSRHQPIEPSPPPSDQFHVAHGSPASPSTPHCTTTKSGWKISLAFSIMAIYVKMLGWMRLAAAAVKAKMGQKKSSLLMTAPTVARLGRTQEQYSERKMSEIKD